MSLALWRFFSGVRVLCVLSPVSLASWRFFTGVRTVCGTCVVFSGIPEVSPPLFFSLFFFCILVSLLLLCFFVEEGGKGERRHEDYSHRPRQIEHRCSSAVFLSVVCVLRMYPRGPRLRGAARVVIVNTARVSVDAAAYFFESTLGLGRGFWA